MQAFKIRFGGVVGAMPLLMLAACASAPQRQVVVGRVSLTNLRADTPILGGFTASVYEVSPRERPDRPIYLIMYDAPCPFEMESPERNDPEQLYRIEYVSSRGAFAIFVPPFTDFITTRCTGFPE